MSTKTGTARLAFAGLCAAIALSGLAGSASAGECPADKVKEGAVTSGETMPVGVTDTVIAAIDLSPKGGDFNNQMLRMRKLVIAPGGVVPWHEHSVRPANIYVLSGEIVEFRANCAVPIVHKAGEVAQEFGAGFAHWWKNESDAPVELLSADILQSEMMNDKMM